MLQGLGRGLASGRESSVFLRGSAAMDMLDRGHNTQWVINMGDSHVWPMTR